MVQVEDELPIRRRNRRVSLLVDGSTDDQQPPATVEPGDDDPKGLDDDIGDDDDDNKYTKYARQRVESLLARDSMATATATATPAKTSTPKRRRSTRLLDDSISESEHSFTSRALSSFKHTAALSFKANRVDAVLAAMGCAGSLALLQWQSVTFPQYAVMHSCLVSSAVKFFFNETPTSLTAFWQSSLFALLEALLLGDVLPPLLGPYTKYGMMFVIMTFWKLYGSLWGPADALALTIAMETGGLQTLVSNSSKFQQEFPWQFVMMQYLAGHLILFGMAHVWSMLRHFLRVWLIRQEFISREILGIGPADTNNGMSLGGLAGIAGGGGIVVSGKERRRRLWELFHRMDTSGDGQLDAVELQVALRAATATDISIADANAIIRSVDSDGNGTVDFDEFCASIEKFWG